MFGTCSGIEVHKVWITIDHIEVFDISVKFPRGGGLGDIIIYCTFWGFNKVRTQGVDTFIVSKFQKI